jgi:protein-tyrosine phosphatase
VRADSVRHLTEAGWDALVEYGVRTIVDLRRHDELERDPPLDVPVDVVHVPLETPDDWEVVHQVWRQEGDHDEGIRAAYVLKTERLAGRFAAAIETIANAPEGGIVVHCFAGKDRTGLTCAMLLRLADVGVDDIAADYGLSGENIRSIIDPWADAAPDERERALRLRIGASPPQVMADVLAELEQRHGTIRHYLLDAGADSQTLDLARDRLLA